MRPTLGILIATPGRRSLWRTFCSIFYQNAPIEDVLVVGDGYHRLTKEMCDLAGSLLKLPIRYVATVPTRDFGHSQQNYGLKHVRGDYVIYQDDDDIFLPRALDEAARLVSEFSTPTPLIGRIKSPRHGLLWQMPGEDAVLDGHCLVLPNDKKKLGWFDPTYNGDQCFIHTSLRAYKEYAWADRIWTMTRPSDNLHPVAAGHMAYELHLDDIGGPLLGVVSLTDDPDPDKARMFASIEAPGCGKIHLEDIAKFLAFAAQGKDVWITVDSSNHNLLWALMAARYNVHAETKDSTELIHSWPPRYWPELGTFNRLMDEDGNVMMDWRDDVWGGRPDDSIPETA